MSEKKLTARVRQAGPLANVIDIEGEISTFSGDELEQASVSHHKLASSEPP